MTNEQNFTLIDAFNCWFNDDSSKVVDIKTMMMEAPKRGYIVEENCSNDVTLAYVKSRSMNPNSTFYRSFQDVVSKNRLELFIDQILHYASTYGTNYEGEVYCPNGEPIKIAYEDYIVIKAVTRKELFDRVVEMLGKNIALSDKMVTALSGFVIESVRKYNYPFDLEGVNNKMAYAEICRSLGLIPTTPDNFMRMLSLYIFGTPMVIQSKQYIYMLHNRIDLPKEAVTMLTSMTEEQKIMMSRSFLRYKKLWLGIRSAGNSKIRKVVNRLRQLARANHRPMIPGFWENLTNWPASYVDKQLGIEVAKLDNPFKIIRLLEMIKYRMKQNMNSTPRLFKIRNGKVWVDENSVATCPTYLTNVSVALLTKLVDLLNKKRLAVADWRPITIKFPETLNLVFPVSERSFIGNIPVGSYFDLKDKDNYFGVYWRGEDGTQDFDLSLVSDTGHKYGWNASYYNTSRDIVFSGDMTQANPEATEMFYASGRVPNGTIMLNRYNGVEGSKYKLFFGQDACKGFDLNYMVNPNTIELQVELTSTTKEQILGRIQDNRVYFMSMDMGNARVSSANPAVNSALMASMDAHINAKEVLLGAGFVEWTPECERQPDFDLSALDKDTMIALLS